MAGTGKAHLHGEGEALLRVEDLLVEFEHPTYDGFLGLSRELERLFGRKVEILTPEGLESIRVKGIAESIRKTLAYA